MKEPPYEGIDFENERISENNLIPNVMVHCYKCKFHCVFTATKSTKYWSCPNCKVMNNCENLIKQILKDTILNVKIVEE